MEGCIFCRVVEGKTATNFVKKGKGTVAFADINPKADVHILLVPKEHISNVLAIKNEHAWLLQEMVEIVQNIIKEKNIETAYRLVVNGGKHQHVPHLHWHLLGGENVAWSEL